MNGEQNHNPLGLKEGDKVRIRGEVYTVSVFRHGDKQWTKLWSEDGSELFTDPEFLDWTEVRRVV